MKRTITSLTIASLLLALAFLSCSASRDGSDSQPQPDIYMAGYTYSGSHHVPALWKNNEPQRISLASDATGEAKSVFVSDGNVYASGYQTTCGTQYAALWINGSLHRICGGGDTNVGNSVFVQGGDIYVAARIGSRAYLWKNSSVTAISTTNSDARGIYVSGSDVYIAGYVRDSQGRHMATLWKNGEAKQLPELPGYQQTSSEANSVYVSGSDVYVAGQANKNAYSKAVLWKNGEIQTLDGTGSYSRSYAYSVHVSGGSVYVAGQGNSNTLYPRALLWKNGALQALTAVLSYASANSVHVSGSDAFVAGQEELKAKVWKNGKEHNSQAKGDSVANAVFAVSGGGGPSLDTRPARVTLNKATLQLAVGMEEKLSATIEPWYVANKDVTWSSSNPNAASVASDGTVTAHGQGSATITATTVDGGKTDACQVSVADVLVSGWRNVSGRKVATLWTNKQPQSLTNGTYESTAESVYSTGTDVFVAGYEQSMSGKFVAKVWRNGSLYQSLSNGTYDAAAYSICVSNSNVYVAGIEYNSQGRPVATLWTNGTAKRLADDTYSSYAYSVATSGSSVYVAGEYRSATGKQIAVLWKDGELQILGNEASNTVASGIAVANGRVYVAGTEVTASNMRNAVLWTDGNYKRISDGRAAAVAYGISVSGGDVCVCGGYQTYSVSSYIFPMVWKNGEAQTLSPGLSLTIGGNARSVFALGGSVFAAGFQRDYSDRDYAFLWVNGTAESLGGLGEARGIFVR